jgi:hypothetical protein
VNEFHGDGVSENHPTKIQQADDVTVFRHIKVTYYVMESSKEVFRFEDLRVTKMFREISYNTRSPDGHNLRIYFHTFIRNIFARNETEQLKTP